MQKNMELLFWERGDFTPCLFPRVSKMADKLAEWELNLLCDWLSVCLVPAIIFRRVTGSRGTEGRKFKQENCWEIIHMWF